MSASSSTTSQPPLPSSPPSAWCLKARCQSKAPGVDRLCGLEGVQVDIAMMRTPDGHGRVELTKFRNPELVGVKPAIAPPNTLGAWSSGSNAVQSLKFLKFVATPKSRLRTN